MEYIILVVGVLITLAAILLVYFSRKKETPSNADNILYQKSVEKTINSEPEPEADPYLDFMPRVSKVEDEETVKSRYKKIEVPAILKSDILQTLTASAMVIRDSKTYKVEFSPEVVKGLKDKSMSLIERVNGKGYVPAVKKDGVSGIYKQAVLVKNVNPALVVNASTNLLTAVIGQQQLAEIQNSLRNMEEKLTTLIQYRDNDFFGRIESRFIYFKEIIERFRTNGVNLGGVEDQKIEDSYAATLQDLKVLNRDLKDISESIDRLKEHETIRKWGEAVVIKDYRKLIDTFNSKQELVLLNTRFIKECYEPYLTGIRNYQEAVSKSVALDEIVAENDNIINAIEKKVKNIEENYKVKMNFGVKALKYRNLESLKEVAPLRINQQKVESQKIPSDLLFEITDDEKVYAYVPK